MTSLNCKIKIFKGFAEPLCKSSWFDQADQVCSLCTVFGADFGTRIFNFIYFINESIVMNLFFVFSFVFRQSTSSSFYFCFKNFKSKSSSENKVPWKQQPKVKCQQVCRLWLPEIQCLTVAVSMLKFDFWLIFGLRITYIVYSKSVCS